MRSSQYLLRTFLMALLAGCAANPARTTPTAGPNTIIIDNFTFNPPIVTIATGTTITWINRDDVPHTVTSSSDPQTFHSDVLDTDGTYRMTFAAAGTYPYYCTVHPHMTATIIVK